MGIDNIWVFAQAADGAPTTGTLELLTKARELAGNVSAFIAGDGAGVAAALGDHGAAKVYATGDLGGSAAGRRRCGRDAGRDRRGRRARPDHVPAELRGPRRDRAACRSSSTARCSPTRPRYRSTATTSPCQTPIFGGSKLVNSTFTGDGRSSPRSVRRASSPKVAPALPARSCRPRSPTSARPVARPSPPSTSKSTPVRSSTRRPSSSPVAVASARPRSSR